MSALRYEALSTALSDGTLLVCGAKLWNALHSDLWRHREAAAQAYLDYIESEKVILKYSKDADSKLALFKATLMIAKTACHDKLL